MPDLFLLFESRLDDRVEFRVDLTQRVCSGRRIRFSSRDLKEFRSLVRKLPAEFTLEHKDWTLLLLPLGLRERFLDRLFASSSDCSAVVSVRAKTTGDEEEFAIRIPLDEAVLATGRQSGTTGDR